MKVTVIEPSEHLRLQTADKLILVDYGVTVMSIDQFYQYGTKDEVLIIDEYDSVMIHHPYGFFNESL